MSTMVAEVYDALIEAGASPDKARAAAVTLANRDDRFVDIETKLTALDARFSQLDTKFDARYSQLDAKFDARYNQLDAKFDARYNQLDTKFDARCNQLDAKFDARCNQLDFKLNLLLTGYGVAALAMISMIYRIGVKLGALPWF